MCVCVCAFSSLLSSLLSHVAVRFDSAGRIDDSELRTEQATYESSSFRQQMEEALRAARAAAGEVDSAAQSEQSPPQPQSDFMKMVMEQQAKIDAAEASTQAGESDADSDSSHTQ